MSWFTNLRTMAKLIVAFTFVCLIMIAVGYIGYSNTQNLDDRLNGLYENALLPIDYARTVATDIQSTGKYVRQHVIDTDASSMAKDKQNMDTLQADVTANIEKYAKANLSQAEATEFANFRQTLDQYYKIRDEIVELSAAGKKSEAAARLTEGGAILSQTQQALDTLVSVSEKKAQEVRQSGIEASESATRMIIISIFVGIIVAMVLGYFVARSISVPLGAVTNIAGALAKGDLVRDLDQKSKDALLNRGDEVGDLSHTFHDLIGYMQDNATAAARIADGDLTVEVAPKSSKDELGNAFANMIVNLREAIGQVAENADSLASSSEQLSSASQQAGAATQQVSATIQQVAKGAGEQTKAVTEAASMVSQMNSAIEQVTDNAQSVAQVSAQATNSAKVGSDTVGKSVKAMERIRESIEPAAEKVKELGVRSSEIGNIVEVIDDIAEQTNLLALNAAIEAARAGEHGKGFAVVADEVRKLAERSSKATKEIANLITNVQKGTSEAVSAMDEGAKQVAEGNRLSIEAGQSLEEILRAIDITNQQVQGISATAQQMSASSVMVVKSTDNISSISEENAAAAEEVSASTEEMSAQVEEMAASAQSLASMAEDLQRLAGRFKLHEAAASDMVMRRRKADWTESDNGREANVSRQKRQQSRLAQSA